MASIANETGDVELVLRPYQVAEDGAPRWFRAALEFRTGKVASIETTISLTDDDLRQLRAEVRDILSAERDQFRFITTDDDFILDVTVDRARSVAAIGFWEGEPALVMRGYRFMAPFRRLKEFARGLEQDERTATGRAQATPM